MVTYEKNASESKKAPNFKKQKDYATANAS